MTKIKLGQVLGAENKRRHTQALIDSYFEQAVKAIEGQPIERDMKRLICALLYLCEGAKDHYHGVSFTNSDPQLIRTFIELLRENFEVDAKRFRVCIHLHEYHIEQQPLFWSKATGIPLNQFMKPYLKPNSGKRIRRDYPGCASLRYADNDVARRLLTTAKAFLVQYGGIS